MDDASVINTPAALQVITAATAAAGFSMASDLKTGSLLKTLAACKPGGTLLELGTGTGLSTAWLLDGMDSAATLLTVDNDEAVQEVARRHLGSDTRVRFYCGEGGPFIESLTAERFDLIFADTWPGKYDHLEITLGLLKPGGFYIIDDMLPQPNWPPEHFPKVPVLVAALEARPDLALTKMNWATGLIVAVKTGDHKG